MPTTVDDARGIIHQKLLEAIKQLGIDPKDQTQLDTFHVLVEDALANVTDRR